MLGLQGDRNSSSGGIYSFPSSAVCVSRWMWGRTGVFIQHIFGEISVLSLRVLACWEQGGSLGQTGQPWCREGLFIKLFVSRAAAQAVYLHGLKNTEKKSRRMREIYFCEFQQQQTIATGGFLKHAWEVHSQGRKFLCSVPLSTPIPVLQLCRGWQWGQWWLWNRAVQGWVRHD